MGQVCGWRGPYVNISLTRIRTYHCFSKGSVKISYSEVSGHGTID